MLKKRFSLMVCLAMIFTVLAACGGGGVSDKTADQPAPGKDQAQQPQEQQKPQESKDPVELIVFSNFKEIDKDFQEIFVKPVQAKYPNISLKHIVNGKGQGIQDLITGGEVPDIIISSVLNMNTYGDLGLFYDQNSYIKQNKFDLNRIQPTVMDSVKPYSEKGEIFGIPYTSNFNALFYNKDIFDKFGVPYPKDGMLWDEVVDLAKKVTRTADGIQYRGLSPENINLLASPYGVGFVDPKTDKATIQSWKPAYELLQKIIAIPGNAPDKVVKFDSDAFVKTKTVAMYATSNILKDLEKASADGMNWDLVTYPQYPDRKGTFGLGGSRALMITQTSKHKDAAFHVIESVLSDAVQINLNRNGTVSPLKSVDVQKTFGTNLPYVKGKNVSAIYKLTPAWRVISQYDPVANNLVFPHSVDLYTGKDVNTVIRETEEAINKAVEQQKSK
jgi:multiple sugar transport system substrate-binding protein